MSRAHAFVLFCSWALSVSAAEMVHLVVKGQPAENGKILNMEFREVERTADASIVEVTFISGGSVSSSMFVLKGQCAVARARGKNYFKSQELTDRPNAYRMTFPTQAAGDLETRLKSGIWAASDCKSLGF